MQFLAKIGATKCDTQVKSNGPKTERPNWGKEKNQKERKRKRKEKRNRKVKRKRKKENDM